MAQDAGSFLQEQQGRNPGVPFIRIGEIPADISHGTRPEHGIHQSVKCNICITVAKKPEFKRNLHAAENQLSV